MSVCRVFCFGKVFEADQGPKFLNSVLSSIGGGGEYVPPSTPRTPAPPLPTPARQPLPSTYNRNSVSTTAVGAGQGQKRKAEEQLPGPYNKMPRRDAPLPPTTPKKTPTTNLPPKVSSIKPSAASSAGKYGGTAKAPNVTPIPATASNKAAPKKGSYAEILARAKAAQTASAHVGVIKHKPKETLSKKERLALQAEASGKSRASAKISALDGRKKTPDSKGNSPAPSTISGRINRDVASVKSRKAPVEAGYKGTARPLPESGYKGTINRSVTAISTSSTLRRREPDDRNYDRSRSTSVTRPLTKSRRYADYSDDDDEDRDGDEEEEGADYESDLSDMEAGAFDVEEEEQISSKVARREDEEELRKEVELKRQKEAMRRKLTQMAAARRRR